MGYAVRLFHLFRRDLAELFTGTKVVHQSPPGCIVPEPDVDRARLFDFESVSEYIIPRQAFCNRFVAICDPDHKYRILGHPVCIKNEMYERNEFMFNFCIVIGTDKDTPKTPYEAVVRRLASTFTEMEIQNQFLSQEDNSNSQDRRSIAALLEIIKEDLNLYTECMIPVGNIFESSRVVYLLLIAADDANTINMKLFPIYEFPHPVKAWHVPVSKVPFDKLIDDSWDLTMKKVLKHIDGVKDVRRIAYDADVALDLVKIALQHLLYYDSIMVVDLFLFGNIYATTPEINDFITSEKMQEECSKYVYINGPVLDNYYLCRLFTSLCTGRTLGEWLKLHLDQGFPVMNYVDVRRFIQFGMIKGFLYRVRKYAISQQYIASLVTGQSCKIEGGDLLQKYTDGVHSFDQITVEKNMCDEKIIDQLRKFPKGDIQILYR